MNKFNSSTTQETTTTKTTMKQEKIIRIIAENPYVSEKMEEKNKFKLQNSKLKGDWSDI